MPENSIGPKISESLAVPAGDFSEWLRDAEASLQSGTGATAVPCGVCTACCRSSMFIHINPEETQTIPRIPRALLFDAPGLPKGHLVMGYNDKGHCPILVTLDDAGIPVRVAELDAKARGVWKSLAFASSTRLPSIRISPI